MSDVMTISKRNAAGLEEVLRTLLLDSDNKVPAKRLRIVGALADGAIIEQGSNANGGWIRYADGTQICTMTGMVSPEGSGSQGDTFTYPAAFTSSPVLVVTYRGFMSGGTSGTTTVEAYSSSGTAYKVKILLLKTGGEIAALVNYAGFMAIAIGRWKA